MLPISQDELERWQVELDQAEKFRDDEFGKYSRAQAEISGAGRNIAYFEKGTDIPDLSQPDSPSVALNLAYVLTKNIVPTLFPKNPKALALPKRKQDADSASYAASVLTHYMDLLNIKNVNQQAVFDAWVLGYGVVKIGYATEWGVDASRTDKEENQLQKKNIRERLSDSVDSVLIQMGLKQPEPAEKEDEQLVSSDEFIKAESPYLRWVDPFSFLIDPRARSVHDAWWVGESPVRKTLWELKQFPHYNQRVVSSLQPIDPDIKGVPITELERFQTVDIHTIQYKNPKSPSGITDLILAESRGSLACLYHEHCRYSIPGWQYEMLAFNKHMHKLYPISDLTVVRPLLDRINSTFDAILEQVDRFYSKIAYNKEAVTPEGQLALRNGGIGAEVAVNGDPRLAFHVISMDQLKSDLVLLMDRLMDFVILQTGMTRAQLTGLSTAQTATEAQIGQGGSINRRTDQADMVLDFANRQADKLWNVIAQYVPLETVELLTGETQYDPNTGLPRFSWLEIDQEKAEKMRVGQYQFNIELTSMQRPNLEILRKQVENLIVVLTNPAINQGLAMQGKRLDVAEGLRLAFKLYPEIISDPDRIIIPIDQQSQQMILQPTPTGKGGDRGGVAEAIRQAPPPNIADMASAAAGERGQGFPLA